MSQNIKYFNEQTNQTKKIKLTNIKSLHISKFSVVL
jgi:hypothetical protein